MGKVQIGFIGAGNFISANHLLTARDSKNIEIAAIADLDPARLTKHQNAMSIGYCTDDYKKLLADPKIDIIVVGTKQDLHASLIVESLDAGKWGFCEKPMAQNETETQAVLAAEKRNPGRLAIGFNRRFAPAYLRTRELMQARQRPWFINYRLMYPNPQKQNEQNFYSSHERILYEGCHVLDYVTFLLDAVPVRVFMTGDPYLNNCCILDYEDGSQVSFMCGSLGSYCLWKEYMEVFGKNTAITVQDFTDMRVRGIPREYDQLFAPHMGEHVDDVKRWGFDFYELYKNQEILKYRDAYWSNYQMEIEEVHRPQKESLKNVEYSLQHSDLWSFVPDKGWISSFEHFAKCYQTGQVPLNADGKAGKLATDLALALLKSLKTKQAVKFCPS
jgi:predicted dehydrogenase